MFVCRQCGHVEESAGFCNRDGSKLEPREDALVGTTVGSYRLTRLVGRGGMGLVYQGVQPAIGSRVAVKVLALECVESTKAVQRFFDEARSVNLIRHENIVNVLDLAYLPDGRPYMVMEFLDGQTLRAAMASQRLPFGLAIGLLGEVLDALSAAHQRGVVHRDLKPDNVFVTPAGHAKVLDFGIAKLRPDLTGDRPPTRTGTVLGTPHYMSPEQAMGGRIDARTDVYSLGVILYEILTGTRPFEAPSAYGLIRMHLSDRPPAPTRRRPGVPRDLEEVALVALEKDPTRRFPTAVAMKEALFGAYSRSGLGVGEVGPAACQSVPLAPGAARGPSQPVVSPHVQGIRHAPPVAATVPEADASFRTPSYPTGPVLPTPRSSGLGRLPLLAVLGCGGLGLLGIIGGAGLLWWYAKSTVVAQADRAVAMAKSTVKTAPTNRRLTLATGGLADVAINLKAFDPFEFVPKAHALAMQHFSDALLTSFYADGLRPAGVVDLTASDDFDVIYSFRSPSRSIPPPNHPTNVDYEALCVVTVYVDADGVRANPVKWECNEPFVPHPTCSMKQIWDKAEALGAPTGNVVGSLRYATHEDTKEPRWYVSIPPKYSGILPDSC